MQVSMPPRKTNKRKDPSQALPKKKQGRSTDSKPPAYVSQHKYFHFTLESGNNVFFDAKKDADAFLADFQDIVKDKHSFKTKTEYTKYKKAVQRGAKDDAKAGMTSPKATIKSEDDERKVSPSELSGVQRVALEVRSLIPGNRLICHIKLMRGSRLVVIIWRFTDVSGKIFWTLKPIYLVQTLRAYLSDDEFKVSDPLIQEALSSFMSKKMRDQDGGPDAVKGRTTERNGRQIFYEDTLPVNTFVLPADVLEMEMEDRWEFVEGKVCGMAHALLQVLSSTPYLLTLKEIVSENFYVMMTAPKNGPTFQAFMRDCSVVLKRMDNSNNFNTHVVLDESKALTDMMFTHSVVNLSNEAEEDNSGSANGDDLDSEGDDNDEQDDDDDDDENNGTESGEEAAKEDDENDDGYTSANAKDNDGENSIGNLN
jgi:hypothetical protein